MFCFFFFLSRWVPHSLRLMVINYWEMKCNYEWWWINLLKGLKTTHPLSGVKNFHSKTFLFGICFVIHQLYLLKLYQACILKYHIAELKKKKKNNNACAEWKWTEWTRERETQIERPCAKTTTAAVTLLTMENSKIMLQTRPNEKSKHAPTSNMFACLRWN